MELHGGRYIGTSYAALVAMAALALLAAAPSASASSGVWSLTNRYPTGIAHQPCVAWSGYAFCIGGSSSTGTTGAVYYAKLSSGGAGSWQQTTPYPVASFDGSCAAYAGYAYCVGGSTDTGNLAAVYYAQLSSGGIVGGWKAGTAYPFEVEGEACFAASSFLYCAGGFTGSGNTNAVYYAPIEGDGSVGEWVQTVSYPSDIRILACAADSTTAYCVGGYAGPGYGSGYTQDSYSAALMASGGVSGYWAQGANYPVAAGDFPCVLASGDLYCVGGVTGGGTTNSVYYGIASGSIQSWTGGSGYPHSTGSLACVSDSGFIYCVGGYQSAPPVDSVYYIATQQAQAPGPCSSVAGPETVPVGAPGALFLLPVLSLLGRRRGVSEMMAVLVIVAIVIAGGLLVYTTFYQSSRVASTNAQISVVYANIATSGGGASLAMEVKNTGSVPLEGVQVVVNGQTLAMAAGVCLQPGQSASATWSTATNALTGTYTAGEAYSIQVTAYSPEGSSTVTTTTVSAI